MEGIAYNVAWRKGWDGKGGLERVGWKRGVRKGGVERVGLERVC